MNNKTFLEEKEKLKEINNKVLEEEKLIEEELRKSDMNYTMEDIAKGEVLLTRVKKLENIKKIKDVPYFARMDFKEENRDLEKLYIGKISILDNKTAEPIIVDWRAPICSLYYDQSIGKAEYFVNNKKISGELNLKSQILIENGEIKNIINTDLVSVDELLQPYLTINADSILGTTKNTTSYSILGSIYSIVTSKWGYLIIIIMPMLAAFICEIYQIIKEVKR